MNLKEKLKKLKNSISNKKNNQDNSDNSNIDVIVETYMKSSLCDILDKFFVWDFVNLDDKVDSFIDWYYKNMVQDQYSSVGEYNLPKILRNFIEKMAVWYELRYPDYEINRLMSCAGQESIKINDVMFKNNKYINDLLDENSDVKALDWEDFYNTKAFINSLPYEERELLSRPRYRELVYLYPYQRHVNLQEFTNKPIAHFHLSANGTVVDSECLYVFTDHKIKDENVIGMHIKDVLALLKENIELPNNNEIEEAISSYEQRVYFKEELLNCVMYRIIERGGNRFGPRRGFIFAKEFKRNISIPMKYGVDYSDPGLDNFITEYIKAGGSDELMCIVDYFLKTSKDQKMNTISIKKLIETKYNDSYNNSNKEKEELYQKMVNVLSSQIDQDELRKEEVKKLRLERKLNKSKNRQFLSKY